MQLILWLSVASCIRTCFTSVYTNKDTTISGSVRIDDKIWFHMFIHTICICTCNMQCGAVAHPIFSRTGGYPPIMRTTIARRSATEGRAWSRLPAMSNGQRDLIRGSADFLGLNYYTSNIAEPEPATMPPTPPSMWNDQEVRITQNGSWPQAKSRWLRSVPQGLREILQ